MRLAITSDTHGREGWILPECDVFIHCGDITAGGSLRETAVFAQYLNSRTDIPHKIIVPGNHDGCFEYNLGAVLGMFGSSTQILIDSGTTIDGHTFWGSPWTPPFMLWHFMREEWMLRDTYEAMPDGLDVLITHGPPRGILDNVGAENVGSTALLEAVQRTKPQHHVFGHIHRGGRVQKLDSTTFHNVAACDEAYKLANPCQVIDL